MDPPLPLVALPYLLYTNIQAIYPELSSLNIKTLFRRINLSPQL